MYIKYYTILNNMTLKTRKLILIIIFLYKKDENKSNV